MAETLSGQSRKTKAIIVDEENSARELTADGRRRMKKRRETPEREKRGSIDRRRSKSEGSYQ